LHAVRKIQLLADDAADFIDAVRELGKKIPTMRDTEHAYEIQCCVTGIENHLAGRYPEPNDEY